ncbi:MAG: RDD family protein [Anaerolineales bacterium]|nr:RDD family protein [Anaerolineales bacterium]
MGVQIILGAFGQGGLAAGQATGEAAFVMMRVIGPLVGLVWSFGYYIFFWATRGQTPGKMMVGIKIIATDGSSIGVGRSASRLIGYGISGIVFYLGYLWVIWDKDKQGWHDKIAGTYVVEA